jgi:hypothetical protein
MFFLDIFGKITKKEWDEQIRDGIFAQKNVVLVAFVAVV